MRGYWKKLTQKHCLSVDERCIGEMNNPGVLDFGLLLKGAGIIESYDFFS